MDVSVTAWGGINEVTQRPVSLYGWRVFIDNFHIRAYNIGNQDLRGLQGNNTSESLATTEYYSVSHELAMI